ncbi:MAG: 7-cyano-7-deazaguanine synthase QueC [Chlorobiota bacterium]|nr:7-cyano-7-deazaguanine synthase QueC [Chlorobiota bacterium]QQS67807.1 MAG: 7-cyano-7-deazaguanine synthase QueC [Chlorobiota bacterium]
MTIGNKSNNSGEKAVVLLSGGMDSCVVAAILNSLGYDMYFLHTNYGQKTENRELKSFNDIADFYNVKKRLSVDIKHLSVIGGSSLTDEKIEVSKPNINSTQIPTSYVPFRNANILCIAVSWAEVISANFVAIGAVEEDSSGYPDCRREFYDSFEKTIELGTKPDSNIKILTPVINRSKKEIIEIGKKLNAPLYLTWSCYKSEDLACGNCDSCALRQRGFELAGITDPIEYAI